jgi:hypothetical protein
MVFDTQQSNTFLEQVPNLGENFDLTTWVRYKSTGSPVTPDVMTSNTGDIYVFVTGTISIDLLPLFTHCSLGGSNLLFCPACNLHFYKQELKICGVTGITRANCFKRINCYVCHAPESPWVVLLVSI